MKFTSLALVVLIALVLMVFATTASATTLEANGELQKNLVTLLASLKTGTSTLLLNTEQTFPALNTCSASTLKAATSVFTGTAVSGGVSSGPTFEKCTEGPVTTDASGTFTIEWLAGTTNGTFKSLNTKVTWSTSVGPLTCITSSTGGTDIGTVTGVASGNATLDVIAALNCGIVTTIWRGTYTVTTPTGLGVTS